MKLVVDSNIFVSSYYYGGNPKRIVHRILDGLDKLYVSSEVLDEIEEVLNRSKFNGNKIDINSFMDSIKKIAIFVNPSEQINASRDIKDNKYLECAVAASANYIVSGDIHLLELKKHNEIIILKAKEYLDIVENH